MYVASDHNSSIKAASAYQDSSLNSSLHEQPIPLTALNRSSEDESPHVPLDSIADGRFVRHQELISKSKYRTIYRGYDNESGCEIAWSTYRL